MIVSTSLDKDYLTEMTNGVEGVAPVYADQPVALGGGGKNMRPGELLLSGLAACMNITARKYLHRDGLPFDKVIVSVDMKNDEEGIAKFYSKIEIWADIPPADKARIINEVKDCPVCGILGRTARFLDLD